MSTLKVESIQHPESSTPAITLDSNGSMTGSFPYANRNLIYNGAMQVHQRGTSVTGITGSGYNTADRWRINQASAGTWTQTVENDAPSDIGFRKSLKMLCTTANNSLSGNSEMVIRQILEGQDLQRIGKGTSSAKQLTVSFWVKSNVTGTYICELFDHDNNRQISKSYTVNLIATWEKKTFSFPADTIGAFDNDNDQSLSVRFTLVAGSDYTSGTLNSAAWTSNVNTNRAVGQTNLSAATNNYCQITGVQLEIGDAATDFEFKSYGQELRECQRYYERGFFWYEGPANGGSQNVRNIQYSVQKRIGVYPTAGNYGNVSGSNANISSHAPEDGYDVYSTSYPQSNSNTGFNWRFVATSTGNCTIRQWWAANAEL